MRAGRPARPLWTYAGREHTALRRALDAAEHALAGCARTPIDALYLARIRELSVEAALCAAAGTPEVAPLARGRFGLCSETRGAASALCAAGLGERPSRGSEHTGTNVVVSDAPDPRSLLSRMREAVGRLRLPFAIVAMPALAPLAATGDRVILVATGRTVSLEDVERTVLHEVEGHARPRARSMAATCALFHAATAGGVDDQEGRALLIEERAGLLGPRRRLQLAARHRAVEAMLAGACFADVARALVHVHGIDATDAVVATERAFRGGDGELPGLGRERIYIESLLRVRAHLDARPDDESVMACGQVALSAIEPLRPFAPCGVGPTPVSAVAS